MHGSVDFGLLIAVIGPSDACKTILLNCIYGKNNESLNENTRSYLNSNLKIRLKKILKKFLKLSLIYLILGFDVILNV